MTPFVVCHTRIVSTVLSGDSGDGQQRVGCQAVRLVDHVLGPVRPADGELPRTLADGEAEVDSGRIARQVAAGRRHVAPVAGGYLTLTNDGDMADRLVSISSPLSDRVEIHESTVSDGVAIVFPAYCRWFGSVLDVRQNQFT